jgi:PHS family inorganic phosphate transporter-like MFS transporter
MGPWLVAYILSFNDSLSHNVKWRLLLGLGAIPATLVVVLSMIEARNHPQDIPSHLDTMPSMQSGDDLILARTTKRSDQSEDLHVWKLLQSQEMQMKLLATGGGWFIYDVAYCKSTFLPFVCSISFV